MENYSRAQVTQNTSKKNHILKIVMLGDCAVGKTSII